MVLKRGRAIRRLLMHHILHADDTPHRLALGAAVGVFIGLTPTVGAQMILAIAITTLLRANKAVAVPLVWISNPLTFVPIYGFAYALGHFLLKGQWNADPIVMNQIRDIIKETANMDLIYDTSYWSRLLDLMMKLSADLWIGSVVLGIVFGALAYPLMYYSTIKYRKIKKVLLEHVHHKDKSIPENPDLLDTDDQEHAA